MAWTVSVVLGPATFALLYKTEAPWRDVCAKLDRFNGQTGDQIKIEDDFGQICSIKAGELKGYLAEDLDQSKFARVEMGLHQTRTQIAAQKAAESDVIIRTARTMQGAAVLDPMGIRANGGRL